MKVIISVKFFCDPQRRSSHLAISTFWDSTFCEFIISEIQHCNYCEPEGKNIPTTIITNPCFSFSETRVSGFRFPSAWVVSRRHIIRSSQSIFVKFSELVYNNYE